MAVGCKETGIMVGMVGVTDGFTVGMADGMTVGMTDG